MCTVVHCGGLPIHFECICSGAVTAADQNSTWFLALGVAELPHDQDLDDDDDDDGGDGGGDDGGDNGGDGYYDHRVGHAIMCGPALVIVMRIC